jgi:hypothetical protein
MEIRNRNSAIPNEVKEYFFRRFMKLSRRLAQWSALISMDSLLLGIIIASGHLCHVLEITEIYVETRPIIPETVLHISSGKKLGTG